MKKNFACIGSAPLLWKGMFLFVPLLVGVLFFLGFRIVLAMYLNKKKNSKLIDKVSKIRIIWFLVVFLSLVTYGIVGLDFNFYLLVFFVTTLLIIGAFYCGEYFRLFKVHHSRWILMTILSLIFATFFVIYFVKTIRSNNMPLDSEQSNCINRLLF
jgi:hypothetical protein